MQAVEPTVEGALERDRIHPFRGAPGVDHRGRQTAVVVQRRGTDHQLVAPVTVDIGRDQAMLALALVPMTTMADSG